MIITDFWLVKVVKLMLRNGYENNSTATLETVGDDVEDTKEDQSAMQSRVASMEEKLDLILDFIQTHDEDTWIQT